MAYLDAEDLAFLAHPLHGLASRCKYLPTIADVTEMLAERKARAEQFTIPKSHWNKFEYDAPEEIDYDRRRRVVRELLGYDPNDRGKPVKREMTPPSAEEVRNLQLKTPAAPATPQLMALLQSQGWPFVPQHRDSEAA